MKKFFLLCLFIVFFFTGCNTLNHSAPSAENITSIIQSFGFTAEEYNWKYDFKTTDDTIVERADAIQKGDIYVETSITPPLCM